MDGEDISDGWVYVITNPAWPGCVKIGSTRSPHRRLHNYQTTSPLRDYKLHCAVHFKNARWAERLVHQKLARQRLAGEWFKVSARKAWATISTIHNERTVQ